MLDNRGMVPLDYTLDSNHHDVCQLPMHSPKPTIQAFLQPAFMTEMNEEEEENALAAFQLLQYMML